jgi:heterodisulfide reductase subunit C
MFRKETDDPVNHPRHYTNSDASCSKCGQCIECIDVTRHMGFNLGNVIKYIWRHDLKDGLQALEKAMWYLEDEIKLRKAKTDSKR